MFVNVVGGVKVTETSADLALLLAMVSSLRDRPLPQDLVVFGEVGLAGEIRPVPSGQSVFPKRLSMVFVGRLFRPRMCRKSAGRDANLWREKACGRAKRL